MNNELGWVLKTKNATYAANYKVFKRYLKMRWLWR